MPVTLKDGTSAPFTARLLPDPGRGYGLFRSQETFHGVELPYVSRTGNFANIYAAACISSSSSMTSCGVLYPSAE
jgi:hypothetical protein